MTLLQYLLIAAVIGLVVFGIAVVVFGRGEQMAPLPPRTSPAHLPDGPITGRDVEQVRFSLALRGYRMSDVDWTLHRLSGELDRLRERLRELDPDGADAIEPDPAVGSDAHQPELHPAAAVSSRAGASPDGPPASPQGPTTPGSARVSSATSPEQQR